MKLSDEQLKGIKFEDSSKYLADLVAQKYDLMCDKLEHDEELKENHIFWLIFEIFRWDFIWIIIVFSFDALLRLAI